MGVVFGFVAVESLLATHDEDMGRSGHDDMVKMIDDKFDLLPDHVGWQLWKASRSWQAEFVPAMRAAGHTCSAKRAPACSVT
jgi:hypothetical protein